MRKYDINDLVVVKVVYKDTVRFYICKRYNLANKYVEILTNRKLEAEDVCVEPLANYYSVLSLYNYNINLQLCQGCACFYEAIFS